MKILLINNFALGEKLSGESESEGESDEIFLHESFWVCGMSPSLLHSRNLLAISA